MKKVVARMLGGLGNQLFIISAAYTLASKDSSEIVLDTREYKTYKTRRFELLEIINDDNVRLYDEKKDKSYVFDVSRFAYHIAQKFINPQKKMSVILSKTGLVYTKRNAEGMNVDIHRDTAYLYGYFQDARMAKRVKALLNEKIRNFDFPYVLDPNMNYIGISIRWGLDYIKQGWPICSKEYFENGVNEIVHEKYGNEKVCVLVFSDEIEKAKQLEFDAEKEFVEGLSAAQQLNLMKKCQDFVISNSSFSWWGAFLGATDNSIVIAPNIWYDTKEPTENTLLTYENMRIRDMGWNNI